MLETSGPVPAFVDAVQARDVNRIAGLLAHDVRLSVPPLHYTRHGPQDVVAAVVDLLRCFDDLRYDVRSRYVAPGTVTDEAVISGRQTGTFLGAEPGRRSSAVPARVIIAHDAATIGAVTVWPDLAALRGAVDGASRMIDLTKVGGAGAMVTQLRATIPPAQARLIIGSARQAPPPPPPPAAVEITSAAGGDGGPLAGRPVPKAPVPRQVRRRRAVLAGGAMAVLSGALTLWVAVGALDQAGDHDGRGVLTTRPSRSAASPTGGGGTDAGATGSPAGAGVAAGAAGARGASGPVPPSALADAPPRLTADITQLDIGSDVLFDTDSSRLKPPARALLDRVVTDARAQRRRGRVTVYGYTDDVGTQPYNLALSGRRAATVADYLRRGLAGTGMTFVSRGFGTARPVADNRTPQGRELNRRVTITFPRAVPTATVTPRPGGATA